MARRIEVPTQNPLGPCPVAIFGDPSTTKSAVVVIQEWWGVTDHMLDTVKEIADMTKSVGLIPDLYRGKLALDRETAGHYSADLDWTGAVQDVEACVRYLKSEGCHKVGVTGFCQGGALAIATAASPTAASLIDAAVPFYGIPRPTQLTCDYAAIKSPLQCHFGQHDNVAGFSTPAEYRPFLEKLKDLGLPNIESYEYDAGHAFANLVSPGYNAQARELSFQRMTAFFDKYLHN